MHHRHMEGLQQQAKAVEAGAGAVSPSPHPLASIHRLNNSMIVRVPLTLCGRLRQQQSGGPTEAAVLEHGI